MANNFCRFLGNQYRIDLDGISPCCYYKQRVNITNIDEFNNFNKKLVNQNTWTEECSGCLEKEQHGIESPRLRSLLRYYLFGLNSLDEPDELTALEIQTDIDCNGACLICGDYSSTTWQKFESKFNSNIIINDKKDKVMSQFNKSLEIFDYQKLKTIGFVNGGEPLKSKTHLLYLNHLDQIGKLKDITISYVTNGSIKPCNETITFWKKAKKIILNISVDAINDHFNYLRWPLRFDQVIDNINYILSLNVNGMLGFSYTLNPFNIFYHDEYVQWGIKFFENHQGSMKVQNIFDTLNVTFGNLGLESVPPLLRLEICKKYGKNSKIFKIIPKYNKHSYNTFIRYILLQDQRRNLNFKETFPEIAKFFITK